MKVKLLHLLNDSSPAMKQMFLGMKQMFTEFRHTK
jgi:hypothetical protein